MSTPDPRKQDSSGDPAPIRPVVYGAALLIYGAFFKLGGVQIYGRENVPRTGPVIIAPNHVSMLDPPLVGWITPRVLRVMAKQELFGDSSLPRRAFDYFIRGIGTFPVQRGRPDRKALRTAMAVLRRGNGLLLFPEGSRSEDGTPGAAEPGLGMIAHATKAPIVPVYLHGTGAAWSKQHPALRLTRTEVHFGKPLRFEEEYAQKSSRQLIDGIGARVMAEIARLRDEAAARRV
jgi:1-acyl-sn-glycerol-3-phosphate acyltransferase